MKPRILVVADDAPTRAMLARWLLAAGYAVELSEGAKRAREVIADQDVALTILAPDRLAAVDDLARALAEAECPFILIEENAEAAGPRPALPAPTSSSISKPLVETDLLARVAAALGVLPAPEAQEGEFLRFEGYTLDVTGRACLDPNGAEVSLTHAEFALLLELVRRPGRVLSRDELRRAIVGRDAEPDDRSVDMLVSRLRRKIETDPKAPRMIITVPREGYKLGVRSHVIAPPAEIGSAAPAASALMGDGPPAPAIPGPAPNLRDPTLSPDSPRSAGVRLMALAGVAGAAVIAAASLLLLTGYPGHLGRSAQLAAAPVEKFDPTIIPLINDGMRHDLETYAARPDFKALAISAAPGNGVGLASGAPDAESAKREALERCDARSKAYACRVYAVGMNVVWSSASLLLPRPADIHAEPLDIRLAVGDIPTLTDAMRKDIGEQYLPVGNPKALAIRRRGYRWNHADDRAEAVRLTIERCSDMYLLPCLLVSVDGFLTIQMPKTRGIEDIFMVASEQDMSEQDKDRVGQVYQGKEWRALARGKGGWYPVAGLPSESNAIEAALAACAQRDSACRLYAIGNFRVAAEK